MPKRGAPPESRGMARYNRAARIPGAVKLSAIIVLFLFVPLSCAGGAPGSVPEETAAEEPAGRRITAPAGALFPESLRPGEPFAAALVLPEDREGLSARLLGTSGRTLGQAPFFTLERDGESGAVLKTALLAVPTLAAPGTGRVLIEGIPEDWDLSPIKEGTIAGLVAPALPAEGFPLNILPRRFQAEVIELDTRNTGIRTDTSPRRYSEVDELQRILDHTGGDMYAEGVFVPPLASTRRTSQFGDRRVYRYVSGTTDTSVHAGIDYGVPRGSSVNAAAPGRVVLAKERIVTGNSVIIEHLPGVYSLYYHLDSIACAEGDMVGAGDRIGESGATGLATGPHLHWEIRVAGENADPDAFTARSLLDRAAICGLLSW